MLRLLLLSQTVTLFAFAVMVLAVPTLCQEGLSLSGKPFDVKTSTAKLHVHLIYFYRDLKLKRLCALESTLRSNPDALVHVHTNDAASFVKKYNKAPLKTLHPDRVVVHTSSFKALFKGTPLGIWYDKKIYMRSVWVNQNLANAARLAVLSRHGGVYMDLDYIVQGNLSALPPNYMALQTKGHISKVPKFKGHHINNGFLKFEAKHRFLWNAFESFLREFNGNEWGKQGPGLMTRVYGRKCANKDKNASWCKTIVVDGFHRVYPFPWQDTPQMLQNSAEAFPSSVVETVRSAPAVHFWSHVWGSRHVKKGSFLAELLAGSCPVCYPSFL